MRAAGREASRRARPALVSRQESLPQNVVYMQKPWLALDVLMLAERAAARMQGPYRAAN